VPNPEDLGIKPRGDARALPLHCKPVARAVDFQRVEELSCSPEAIAKWHQYRNWCENVDLYAGVATGLPTKARLSQHDIDQMLQVGSIRYLHPGEMPRAYCDFFAVAEWAKLRRRRVVNPKSVNQRFGPDTLESLDLPSRTAIRNVAFKGDYSCCLDASSFFDQIGISDDVGLYFCFRDSKGSTLCLTALAMGQRQSTHIATALMRLVCDFDHDGVAIDIATDNVRFVGSKDAVHAAVKTFLARCNHIGLVINEIPSGASDDDVRALIKQENDFLGEIINYGEKTVRIRQKIIDRIEELWARRDRWTHRQLIGLYACLLWCRIPLAVDMSSMYSAMCALRDLSRALQRDERLWERRVHISDAAMADLERWYKITSANRPTKIADPSTVSDVILITDASRWGWGACAVIGDVVTRIAQAPWGDSLTIEQKQFSTVAEPEAIWRAICRLVPKRATTVTVLTDHAPFVGASAKGYSPSASANAVLHRIKTRFPCLTIRARHIPGRTNPMDGLSRARGTNAEFNLAARRVQQMGVQAGFSE
jgi:hypothetical protein